MEDLSKPNVLARWLREGGGAPRTLIVFAHPDDESIGAGGDERCGRRGGADPVGAGGPAARARAGSGTSIPAKSTPRRVV